MRRLELWNVEKLQAPIIMALLLVLSIPGCAVQLDSGPGASFVHSELSYELGSGYWRSPGRCNSVLVSVSQPASGLINFHSKPIYAMEMENATAVHYLSSTDLVFKTLVSLGICVLERIEEKHIPRLRSLGVWICHQC
jgi:hypothetical protein